MEVSVVKCQKMQFSEHAQKLFNKEKFQTQANMQKSFVQKLESLRKLVYMRLPQLNEQNILQIMDKLAHYHYDKKKYVVLGLERELYNLLIENSYNPFTV